MELQNQDISSENASAPAVANKGRGFSSDPNHVLIIEDDKFLRDLITQKLFAEGFKVQAAVDGESGLKILKEESIELIILDLLLPGIDGFEVLKRIKEDEAMKSIPVVVLSNLGQREDIDRAMSLGAEDFMVKANFTPNEIIDKIKGILRKKYL